MTEAISKIADYFMKQIIPSTATHLKDSQTLIKEIKEIGQLPPHAKLFMADAMAMYTNIQPDVGIEATAG
jgi:signal recognition particle GTPase